MNARTKEEIERKKAQIAHEAARPEALSHLERALNYVEQVPISDFPDIPEIDSLK